MTEEERFAREDRLNLARDEFALREEACRGVGGAMQVSGTPLARNGYHDYKSARCVTF